MVLTMRRKAPLPLALVAIAVLVPASEASHVVVPPGNSQIDQYFETAPGPGGNNSIDGPDGPGGTDGADGADGADEAGGGSVAADAGYLGAEELEQLEKLGGDGQRAAELAAATAPEEPKPDAARGGSDVEAASGAPSREGLGIGLPLILAATAIVAAGFLLRQRLGHARAG